MDSFISHSSAPHQAPEMSISNVQSESAGTFQHHQIPDGSVNECLESTTRQPRLDFGGVKWIQSVDNTTVSRYDVCDLSESSVSSISSVDMFRFNDCRGGAQPEWTNTTLAGGGCNDPLESHWCTLHSLSTQHSVSSESRKVCDNESTNLLLSFGQSDDKAHISNEMSSWSIDLPDTVGSHSCDDVNYEILDTQLRSFNDFESLFRGDFHIADCLSSSGLEEANASLPFSSTRVEANSGDTGRYFASRNSADYDFPFFNSLMS